jgi:hypothetical protein
MGARTRTGALYLETMSRQMIVGVEDVAVNSEATPRHSYLSSLLAR